MQAARRRPAGPVNAMTAVIGWLGAQPTQADLDLVVVRSVEALSGTGFDSDTAWDFIDLAAANLAGPNTGASFDGLYDALVTETGGDYRLAVTDLEEIRAIVAANTFGRSEEVAAR